MFYVSVDVHMCIHSSGSRTVANRAWLGSQAARARFPSLAMSPSFEDRHQAPVCGVQRRLTAPSGLQVSRSAATPGRRSIYSAIYRTVGSYEARRGRLRTGKKRDKRGGASPHGSRPCCPSHLCRMCSIEASSVMDAGAAPSHGQQVSPVAAELPNLGGFPILRRRCCSREWTLSRQGARASNRRANLATPLPC